MSQAVPASHFRPSGVTAAGGFSRRVHDILDLDELVASFRDVADLYGARGHACFAVDTPERRFLFGDWDLLARARSGAGLTLSSHSVVVWDQKPYEVDFLLSSELDASQSATLNATASLYLNRGIALIEADGHRDARGRAAIERFCVQQFQSGKCHLDTAEELGCSAHAVGIHLARAIATHHR
jgi:hypothetical protein